MNLEHIYKHLFDRDYMSGIDRKRIRVQESAECFTPTWLVEQRLDTFSYNEFTNPTKTFLDPSCGDGQFLASVLYRKLQNGIDFETALSTIYGVDLMQDNVDLCRERLLGGREDLQHIIQTNIVCADGLRYSYEFAGPGEELYPEEAKQRQQEELFASLFE